MSSSIQKGKNVWIGCPLASDYYLENKKKNNIVDNVFSDPNSSDVFKTSRWIQAVFHLSDDVNFAVKSDAAIQVKENIVNEAENDFEVDMSDGVVAEMFGVFPSDDNEVLKKRLTIFGLFFCHIGYFICC